ncbi:MAG: restriction endonuclease [Chloroflexi bacterium]|nr:restriction endonuclease [Chloroflexota bacterium]
MASKEEVGLPGYRELRCRTLEVIRDLTMPTSNADIDMAVADAFSLTAEQRSLPHGEGSQTELAYRTAWARSGLVAAGAIENVSKALWRLTPAGLTLTCSEIEQARAEYLERLKADKDSGTAIQDSTDDEEEARSWQDELIDHLVRVSPKGFEHLAAALLRAAGFDDVEVTGRSSDGGIDGIGTYHPSGLISFHTAFQCKRYKSVVGAPTVRDFRGSFIGRSDRGIVITTGTFTREAREEAARPGANPVDLIDGAALCQLLKEHSLGVRTTQRLVEDVTVDEDYFRQFKEPT